MTKSIITIADLEREYYGPLVDDQLRKTQTATTALTTYRNIIYGAKLWSGISTAANTFGILPKLPWDKSGYRIVSAASATTVPGVAAAGAIPTAIIPTIINVDITPKLMAASFEMDSIMTGLENVDDNVKWADMAAYMGDEFKNRIDRALNQDIQTLAGTSIESIDRIVSDYVELASQTLTAGDADIYSIDRDAAGTTNTYISGYVGHNSATDRYLALSHIDGIFQNVRPYWDDPSSVANKVIQTGYDTELRLAQLLQSQLRYTTQRVQPGVGGLKTMSGVDGGFDVASYNGVPIIPNGNTQAETISRVYLLDLDHIGIGVLKPVQYIESDDYQALGYFLRQGVYYSEMELVANRFRCHGKIIDLK